MSYPLAMFATLVLGTLLFTGGMVLMNRSNAKNPYAIRDSKKSYFGWGLGFVVSFASEFTLLGYL